VRVVALFAAAALLSACAALPSKPTFLSGQWGGQGVNLLLEGGIGTVEFDCAGGSIDVNLPATGPFSAAGSYRAGQPGPIRVGQIFTSQKATYFGTASEKEMTLNVRVEDGTMLGPFTLTPGSPGQLNRCL
jgi:hypothetical protein